MLSPVASSTNLWPFRPRPLEGEGFASWFARLAWANGLSAGELYPIVLPGSRLFRTDLDRFACDALIENLSAHTGIPPDDLWSRTIRTWLGRLFEDDDGRSKLIWLPPAGFTRYSKTFGQQACPQCLREDDTPYLRQSWRLAFVTACEIHHTLLIDRCPACAAPIQPLYAYGTYGLNGSDATVAKCWHCRYDLRDAMTPRVDDLTAQHCLLKVLFDGWGDLDEYGPVHSQSYFRILWSVYRLIATGRFALPLRQWIDGPEPHTGIPRIKEIERLNPHCRHALLAMAMDLMTDWPHRFVDACRHAGLTARHLIKDPMRTPFALWEPVHDHLTAPGGEITPQLLASAKNHLTTQGCRPTYPAMENLLGLQFQSHRDRLAPAKHHAPYGTHRYWKLDGVSPDVRAAAKRAAHQAGENVGAWVDQELRKILC